MRSFLQGNPAAMAFIAALMVGALLAVSYFAFEPIVSYGATDTFTITQQITSEISFRTPTNDVTMTPAIAGITGGNAFGTSTIVVETNNPSGYNMTIAFSTTTAMHNSSTSLASVINNYGPASAGVPDYNWSVGANTGEFGYTVNSVTNAGDIDARFKDNGSACNIGSGTTVGKCWYNAGVAGNATTPVGIINRTTATAGTGATSTVVFQVGITANPSPAIKTGFYIATATLTAVTNP
jgi:hypothetical protein